MPDFRSDIDSVVLGVLAAGSAHGYEIASRIRAIDPEVLSHGEGLIYPALRRLETGGLIEGGWEAQEGKPDRKVYTLTSSGRAAREQALRKWKRFRSAVDQALGIEEEPA